MFTIDVTNQDGSKPGFDYSELEIEKCFDKFGTLDAVLKPQSSISESSTIEAQYLGTTRFRGYVDYPEQLDDNNIRVTAYEQQRLLEYRMTYIYNYPANTAICDMITSNTPTNNVIGLLFVANSLVPNGLFELYSGNVYYIRDYNDLGGGTSSKFGTISAVYQADVLLAPGASPTLNAGEWYQDANEFYIRCTDNANPKYRNILVPNFKDTLLRVGDIDPVVATEKFSVPYRIAISTVQDELERLLDAFGLEWRWQHDPDGYTYLDVAETIGRGSSTRGVTTFKQATSVFDYQKQSTGNTKLSGLVGAGSGSGFSLQTAASLDLYEGGMWREEIYSDSNLFSEQLHNTIDKVFPDRKDCMSHTLVAEIDPSMDVGDYIDIIPEKTNRFTDRVKRITYKHDGSMEIEAGQRLLDPMDVFKEKFSMISTLTSALSAYLTTWAFHFSCDNLSNDVPMQRKFKVKEDLIDTSYEHRFMLNFTLGFYKRCIASITIPSHDQGGPGGGGAEAPEHKHTLKTSQVIEASDDSISVVIDSDMDVYLESNVAHQHLLAGVISDASSGEDFLCCINQWANFTYSGGSHLHTVDENIPISNTAYSGSHYFWVNMGDQDYEGMPVEYCGANVKHDYSSCACGPFFWVSDCGYFVYLSLSGHTHLPNPTDPGESTPGTHTHPYTFTFTKTGIVASPEHTHGAPSGQHTDNSYYSHTHSFDHAYMHRDASTDTHTHHVHSNTVEVDTLPDYQMAIPLQPSMVGEIDWYPVEDTTTRNPIIYLDVSVKLNGSHVDGSPFIHYYPGDSVSDINVSDLVLVDNTENTLDISIVSNSDADPVRCSVSGSVTAKYFMTDI